jgi:hypothetical protein
MTYAHSKEGHVHQLFSTLALVILLSSLPASAGVKVSFPVPGSSSFSPVRILASATSSQPITKMAIYVDNNLVYITSYSAINAKINMNPGTRYIVVQSWDTAGVISKTRLTITVKSAGVTIMYPGPNTSRQSPVQIIAAAKSSKPITSMRIDVDGVSRFGQAVSSINTFLKISPGAHYLLVQSWDSAGLTATSSLDLTVQATPVLMTGRDQYLALPYQAGTTHIDGRYAFGNSNFLLEGANQILGLGGKSIFLYLYPKFRSSYPDKSSKLWPATDPLSVKALAQTEPYKRVFNMPFKLYALTTFTFSNRDNVYKFLTDSNAAVTEEREFYDLALYLLTAYAGTGKTFVLKHWEGDWVGLQDYDTRKNISPDMVRAMIIWLSARQRGVERARAAAGNPLGVAVFNAVEVNRVLDYSRLRLTRVINGVVPEVKPDIITYSSYDSTTQGTDANSMASYVVEALNTIKSLAPDPLNLGSRRILVSEYGVFENWRPTETAWRSQAILQRAKAAGLSSAFLWQVFDNECKDSTGAYFPVASSVGSASRPRNSQCHGLWIVRPDGSTSLDLAVLSSYWY